ncbi:MAG: hypothetical protein EBR82_77330 [Caulobacteraceae bacterium]|nr:hypothetical protein [Caulobacteraceae bacterium]
MLPPARSVARFTPTLNAPLTIHTTAYSHVVMVTVGSGSSDNCASVIFAAVLAHFQRLGIARKLTKPARWSVSRIHAGVAAPTIEIERQIEEQRNALLQEHFNVHLFYAHDFSGQGCPQCKQEVNYGYTKLQRGCLHGTDHLLFRDGKTGEPY